MTKKLTNQKYIYQKSATLIMLIVSIILFTVSLFLFQASRPTYYNYGIYNLNTPINAGQATVTINKIDYDKGSKPYVAPEGKEYLVIDTTFANNSDKSINIIPSSDTYIKDQDGRVYYLTPLGLEEPLRAGELMAHDKITGQLSYLVSKDKHYTMYIDSIWSGGVVSVRLN